MNKNKQFKKVEKSDVLYICCVFFVLFSVQIFPQDSIPTFVDKTEENELKFQQFFFKALTEKSIGNYQKAIENLENCNQLSENNEAVFFEFSKNYLLKKNTHLAKEYVNLGLKNDQNSFWLLKHLVAIFVTENDFKNAIKTQQKISKNHPKERVYLVRLYIKNKEYEQAISLMNVLEKEDGLPMYLKAFKKNLGVNFLSKTVQKTATTDVALIIEFEEEKSYQLLKKILQKPNQTIENLLKYSSEGISLFPAQPFVYLVSGKTLNRTKKFKDALSILQSGIDFVIEDEMEANFYEEMATSYLKLGNKIEAKKLLERAKKIKK